MTPDTPHPDVHNEALQPDADSTAADLPLPPQPANPQAVAADGLPGSAPDDDVAAALAAVAMLDALAEDDEPQEPPAFEEPEHPEALPASDTWDEAPEESPESEDEPPHGPAAGEDFDEAPATADDWPDEERYPEAHDPVVATHPQPAGPVRRPAPPAYVDEPVQVLGPPLLVAERGRMASVVPALLLIITGSLLTIALVTETAVPLSAAALALGLVGLVLLAVWISNRRWARGLLFAGAFLLCLAIAATVGDVDPEAGLTSLGAWFAFAMATGLTVTGLLGRPFSRNLVLVGLLLGAGLLVFLLV
jgi:hypothetical protein